MSFKEVSSFSEEVDTFLNQDNQLDRNSKQDIVRPDIVNLKEEILRDRTKQNYHSNKDTDNFLAFPTYLSILGPDININVMILNLGPIQIPTFTVKNPVKGNP